MTSAIADLLTGRGAHVLVANALEALDLADFGARPAGVPHSIYEELWHLRHWQDLILDWIDGVPTAAPAHAVDGWPCQPTPAGNAEAQALVIAFRAGLERACVVASDPRRHAQVVRKGRTVRALLESLLAHNAYHLGRIVLLRQLRGSWPPPSGGDTW